MVEGVNGKRRSSSQRIGKKGESLFSTWAVDHHLSPNKTDEDLGVDFFCQVLRPGRSAKSEEVTGGVLAVHVRATEGDSRPRILLNKTDAANILGHTHPACLIGIQVKTGQIGFLFVEEQFIDRLREFVNSNRRSLSIRIDEMELDSNRFDEKLMVHVRPGVQHRLGIYKAQRTIEAIAPGASVALHHTSGGGSAIVQMPWISSAFSINPEVRDEVRKLAFETGTLPDQWPGLSIRPEFSPLFDLVDGPSYVLGAIERDDQLVIESGGERGSAIFRVRRVGDEFAYVHDMGLALVHSERRKHEKAWVHEMEARLFKGLVSLRAGTKDLPFFRLLRPGAHLLWRATPVGIETWGDAVPRLGRSVVAIEKVIAALGLDLNDFYLCDLRDEEFANSLGFLEALLIEKIPAERVIPGFIVDSDPDRAVDELPAEVVTIELPVVMNVKTTGIVVWIRARATIFFSDDGQRSGLRVEEQFQCWHAVYPPFEKSPYPELWVTSEWPTIPISEFGGGTQAGRRQEPEKFVVEARVLPPEEQRPSGGPSLTRD